MLMYVVFRLGVFLARQLPERWGMAVARWLGAMAYRFSPVAKAGRDNARHVLGEDADAASVSELARQVFQNRVLNYYDLVRLSGMPLDELSRRMTIEGLEHIEQLVAAKQGAVVAAAHIGPMELMIQAVASLGYPLIGVTEHLEPERLHEYVIGLRSAHGLNLISTRGSLLDVYRRIKRGEILLSTLDRDATDTGLIVDFLGAPAWMPDGYARVAVVVLVDLDATQYDAQSIVGFEFQFIGAFFKFHETADEGTDIFVRIGGHDILAGIGVAIHETLDGSTRLQVAGATVPFEAVEVHNFPVNVFYRQAGFQIACLDVVARRRELKWPAGLGGREKQNSDGQ